MIKFFKDNATHNFVKADIFGTEAFLTWLKETDESGELTQSSLDENIKAKRLTPLSSVKERIGLLKDNLINSIIQAVFVGKDTIYLTRLTTRDMELLRITDIEALVKKGDITPLDEYSKDCMPAFSRCPKKVKRTKK